jgi:asparagine synthetase B (glutamine-hydrolysing)
MCGLAGYWGDFDAPLLDAMTDVLGHRGPDDLGTWRDPGVGVGLGYRRLAILDLSPRGHQPMHDPGAGRRRVQRRGVQLPRVARGPQGRGRALPV